MKLAFCCGCRHRHRDSQGRLQILLKGAYTLPMQIFLLSLDVNESKADVYIRRFVIHSRS